MSDRLAGASRLPPARRASSFRVHTRQETRRPGGRPSVVPALSPVSPARSCPGVRWSLLVTAAGTARRRSGDGLLQGCFHARQRLLDVAHRYGADAEAEPAVLAAQAEGLE